MHNSHGRLSPAPWPASGQLYIYKPAGYTLAPASCWACLNLRQFFLDLSLTYILYKPILFTCQAACCLLLVACCLPLVACCLRLVPELVSCQKAGPAQQHKQSRRLGLLPLDAETNNKERTSRTHPEIFNLEILLVSPKVY